MKLISIKEASEFGSEILGKNVLKSNISYLINYGKIKKYLKSGTIKIDGIFSNPPYVGLINYYEKHAYDLHGFERTEKDETDPLYIRKSR